MSELIKEPIGESPCCSATSSAQALSLSVILATHLPTPAPGTSPAPHAGGTGILLRPHPHPHPFTARPSPRLSELSNPPSSPPAALGSPFLRVRKADFPASDVRGSSIHRLKSKGLTVRPLPPSRPPAHPLVYYPSSLNIRTFAVKPSQAGPSNTASVYTAPACSAVPASAPPLGAQPHCHDQR